MKEIDETKVVRAALLGFSAAEDLTDHKVVNK